MAIATTTQFWNHRLNGDNPADPPGEWNATWTLTGSGSDGSATGDNWRISGSGQTWKVTPAASDNDLTIVACIQYQTTPTDGTVLLALDNGTKRVEVHANGGDDKVKLVGATTVTSRELDLKVTEENATPVLLRLTLSSDGTANLYLREIMEDDDGNTMTLSVAGSSPSSDVIQWGNTSGSIDWCSVYATTHGAFSPDELALSAWVNDTMLRMGFSIVEKLKACKRTMLKTHVHNSAIIYGFDISSQMLSRIRPPSIHVLLQGVESPEFVVLGGSHVDQNFEVTIYVTTQGSNYENAYRLGMAIAGDVFDELYTNTGLDGNVDSLENYQAQFDTKMDSDEVICIHVLRFRYRRRISMRRR